MDAAEPAGAHEPDPGGAAGGKRPPDRRRADGFLHDRGGEVARPDLARVGGEAAELLLAQSNAERAVEDADRGGYRPRVADAALALEPDLDAFAGREAVRDERRLECDDRLPVGERVRDLIRDGEQVLHGIEPSCATQRAAAASAACEPPTR